jgi:hypothetical protein
MTHHQIRIAPSRRRLRLAVALAVAPIVAALAPSAAPAQNAAQLAFRNAVEAPPPSWTGPVFSLSRNYPAAVPAQCPECTWLQVKPDFNPRLPPTPTPNPWVNGKWADYIASILAYVKEGQDPQLSNAVGFRTDVNGHTRWFNVPWMAYDPSVGREFVHGTTNERTAHVRDLVGAPALAQSQSIRGVNMLPGMTPDCAQKYPQGFETWSVGYYNEWGGVAIGQAFPSDGQPRTANYLGSQMPAGLPFTEGTVVVKFLTTSAPVDCVPYLKGSPEWQINRHTYDPNAKKYTCVREVQTSRLLQVDVAVIDLRSPTRWVYGTFGYDGNVPGDTVWDHLVPLGIQFGSDPWTFPAVPKSESLPAQQTVLNPDVKTYQHNGCNMRLAGPADNAQSSCMSCHGSGFAAGGGQPSTMGVNIPPAFGFAGMCTQYSLANAAYFQDIVPPQKFSGGQFADAMSLDTSLQLQVAFNQYGIFNTRKQPNACRD